MKKVALIVLGLLAIIGAIVGFALCKKADNRGLLMGGAEYADTAATTIYTPGPSANGTVTLVTTSTARTWVRIVTTSTGVYVNYGGGAYSATTREPLLPYLPLEFDAEHMYIGTITAKADATTTVSVTTFTD